MTKINYEKEYLICLSALDIMKIYEAEKRGEPNEALRIIGEGMNNAKI